jgi:hypothetical protein
MFLWESLMAQFQKAIDTLKGQIASEKGLGEPKLGLFNRLQAKQCFL